MLDAFAHLSCYAKKLCWHSRLRAISYTLHSLVWTLDLSCASVSCNNKTYVVST